MLLLLRSKRLNVYFPPFCLCVHYRSFPKLSSVICHCETMNDYTEGLKNTFPSPLKKLLSAKKLAYIRNISYICILKKCGHHSLN